VLAGQVSFADFKASVDRILPVFKEATAKERALSGSKSQHATTAPSLKRKRTSDADVSGGGDYFFAKFLTSPDLLELEVIACTSTPHPQECRF